MPTLTVTVELSEEAYRNAVSLPISERAERVIAAFATAPNREADLKLTQEDLDSIGRGLAEIDAGRARPMSEFFTELYTEQTEK